MTHSDFEATSAIRQKLAIGYNLEDKGNKLDAETAEKEHQSGRGYKVPNGALYTTVGDLAKFEQLEMLGGPESVLSKKEMEENAQRLITGNRGLDFGYGIGFLVQRQAGHVFIGHSGAVAGYFAMAMFQPTAETGIIILHNEIAPGMEKLMEVFAKTLPVKDQLEDSER